MRVLGGLLVSGGEDKIVKLWMLVGGGECVSTLAHGASVKGVAISSSGFVASVGGAGKNLVVWRAAGGKVEA